MSMEKQQIARDEDIIEVSVRLIEQNREAYEDLAKSITQWNR